jgi:high-affinity iron transporter
MIMSTATLSFREFFEVGMVLSILCAATRHMPHRLFWYSAGILLGIGAAYGTALLLESLASRWIEDYYETAMGLVLVSASLMIGWTVLWMRQHGQRVSQQWKQRGAALREGQGSMLMVSLLMGVTLWREATELFVLLWASMMVQPEETHNLWLGLLLGGGLAFLVTSTMYWGITALPVRRIFAVTNWLMVALAASLLGQGASFLAADGWLPELSPQLWDSSGWIAEDSMVGILLRSLVGYTPYPSGIQLLAMGLMWVILAAGLHLVTKQRGRRHETTHA